MSMTRSKTGGRRGKAFLGYIAPSKPLSIVQVLIKHRAASGFCPQKHGSRVGVTDVDVLGEELLAEIRYRVHTTPVFSEKSSIVELGAALLDIRIAVIQVGRVLIDVLGDRLRRQVTTVVQRFQDSLVGLRHPIGRLPHHQKEWLENHNTAESQDENWLRGAYWMLSQVLYWFGIDVDGNDCRSATGRRKHDGVKRPGEGRFAVVPAMRPDDRARMYAPGMDNCIGTRDSYHAAKPGVAV